MSSKIAILTLFVFTIIVCPTAYAMVFKNYQAIYTVKYDGIRIGQSITTLTMKADHYQLCIKSLPNIAFLQGKIEECSEGLIHNDQIAPQNYHYFYQRNQVIRKLDILFNWSQQKALIKADGKQWHIGLLPGTQDKISYQLGLRQGLANHQSLFNFPIADGGKIKHYQFKVVNQAQLSTVGFTGKTIKLMRSPIEGKQQITLWLAPDLQNIVVKVIQQKHFIDHGTAELVKLYVNV